MSYAFTFDASACTGCKACQVACKDKNDLPLGVLWRRVYEVSGGGWQRRGAAWTNTVFAYNVSVACHHCAEPACAAACPTGACTTRNDGIVWIDAAKCVGCEYCGWACPYSAPQYSRELGRMTKCDLCRDLVDEGLSPACVAACPMRALELTEVESEGPAVRIGTGAPVGMPALWDVPASTHPYPLPAFSRTQPRIAIKPHPAMQNTLPKVVANREEVRPPGVRPARVIRGLHIEDLPLVAFTLLTQAAAGIAMISLVTRAPGVPVLTTIGVLMALGLGASLLHLGNPSHAWRAAANAATSPLSREIAAVGLFVASWLLAWFVPVEGRVLLALCGVALVHAMAEVYAIDGMAGWNGWQTRRAFAWSALLLGLVVELAVSGSIPLWLSTIAAAVVLPAQVMRRWRFYEIRRDSLM